MSRALGPDRAPCHPGARPGLWGWGWAFCHSEGCHGPSLGHALSLGGSGHRLPAGQGPCTWGWCIRHSPCDPWPWVKPLVACGWQQGGPCPGRWGPRIQAWTISHRGATREPHDSCTCAHTHSVGASEGHPALPGPVSRLAALAKLDSRFCAVAHSRCLVAMARPLVGLGKCRQWSGRRALCFWPHWGGVLSGDPQGQPYPWLPAPTPPLPA